MQCRECHADLPGEARFCLSCGARVPPPADPTGDPLLEALDAAIGFQYRIERLLGRGGMGAVYLAHELALDRQVAIKVLPPEHGAPEVRERFRREARTAARLNHPNIVPLHTFGEVAGLMYFVMAYVPGESLAARMKRDGALDVETARTFVAAVCDALDYAHRHGIVHRDIKPDNILIDPSGVPLLTDFGIAKSAAADAQLTSTGQSVGTPHYMSPEQALGRDDVGPKSDLYSLGIVAYQLVAATRPFEAATPLDALTQRLTRDPRPLASVAPDVAPDYAAAVHRCLQRDPDARWPDAKSFRESLLPTDEESEDSFPARVLRTFLTVAPVAFVAYAWLIVYAAITADARLRLRATAMATGALIPLVLGPVAMIVRLRLTGLGVKTILRSALQQPRWWRSWYPRALRRPGDVWERLPREIRRFRTVRGVGKLVVFAGVIPAFFVVTISHLTGPAQVVIWTIWIVAVLATWTTRHRATKLVCAATGVTPTEASAILNTPTWRSSTWRRPPPAALLRIGLKAASPGRIATPAETTRLAANVDQPTRVS